MALTKLLMPVCIFMLVAFGKKKSVFFDIRVCHRNAHSYRVWNPLQIYYKKHESKTKRRYVERVIEIEQETFTPLVFTTTGGILKCLSPSHALRYYT